MQIVPCLALGGALAGALVMPATAQTWPARPIRLVMPYPTDGGGDIAGRAVAARLAEALGQPIVIDNRPGAGTTIGTAIVARAAPDGYTLLLANSALAINLTLYPKLPYESLADLAPVSLVATNPSLIVVHPSLPANSVKELIALAKAQPGKLGYSSSGAGRGSHLGAALFASMAGVQLTHVPYGGAATALAGVTGGQVQLMFATTVAALPHLQAHRLRALAVTSGKRSAQLPDLPTVAEAALPGYEFTSWYMLVAPAGTPESVLARLHQDLKRVVDDPRVRQQLAKEGADIGGSSSAEAAAYLKADIARWAKVIRETGVKPEG